jgi:hypothetical protein
MRIILLYITTVKGEVKWRGLSKRKSGEEGIERKSIG